MKASFVARELSKTRLCERLGAFQSVSERRREAAQRAPQSLWKEYEHSLEQARMQRREAWSSYRNSASREREQLKRKYHFQRSVIAALPVAGRNRKQLLRQLALRQTIETRALKRKLAVQGSAIQKTWRPGTWRHFMATRAVERDARAIRFVQQ